MELVKNIFFNTDKIVENTEVKLTYAGTLFQNGSEGVTIHYGYGENWEHAEDIEMVKTELGYQANITIAEAETLNLCFKNTTGEWDNNGGANYQFAIEKQVAEEFHVEFEAKVTEITEEPEALEATETPEAPIAVYKTPSWGELFKKTFNNLVNYFTKLFSKNTETAQNGNNE